LDGECHWRSLPFAEDADIEDKEEDSEYEDEKNESLLTLAKTLASSGRQKEAFLALDTGKLRVQVTKRNEEGTGIIHPSFGKYISSLRIK